MTNSNTNLINALASGASLMDAFREELEKTINTLLKNELTGFLNYEKHDVKGYNSGNSRNGYYSRTLKTAFGEITVQIPRDRNGEFHNQTLTPHQREYGDLESMVIHLYRKGVTTRDIADLIEKMYGCHYSAQTISTMTMAIQEQVTAFHQRTLSSHYAVVYCDATYIPVRRGTVQKEALHILLGITPEGHKEVIDYVVYPSESVAAYEELFNSIKERGVTDVKLFVTDGFKGLRDICLAAFPEAQYQRCWVHITRNIRMMVRKAHVPQIVRDLKKVYRSTNRDEALAILTDFLEIWGETYPKLAALLSDVTDLFTFMAFPESIHSSIYTTNIIEGFNKQLKSYIKRKDQFPSEESLDRFIYARVAEYNVRFSSHCHRGFREAQLG